MLEMLCDLLRSPSRKGVDPGFKVTQKFLTPELTFLTTNMLHHSLTMTVYKGSELELSPFTHKPILCNVTFCPLHSSKWALEIEH